MKYGEKNDGGIELHISVEERELLYNALRHFSAYSEKEIYIMEQMGNICEILNVLHLSEFDKRGIEK